MRNYKFMKNIFSKAISFIKSNPGIVYSLILVFLIPIAFFVNTYLINLSYEDDINKITQRKAILVEDMVNIFMREHSDDNQKIQEVIDNIVSGDSEIIELTVSKPSDKDGVFEVVASNNKEAIGVKKDENIQDNITWSTPEGIAFLDKDDKGRFWRVTKSLKDVSGERVGLVSMSLSLSNTDYLINQTIRNSYWILFITVFIVLLFVSNQARLFGYALMVEKMKEVDRMKDMFISMASHELRSPLSAIKGYVDFLKEKKEIFIDNDVTHYVENISLSIDRLSGLVEDMLEVSRIEGNRIPIETTSFDVDKIIYESIEEIKPQAVQKGLELSFDSSDKNLFALADRSRLKQVLINLIGNSIKYTPSGSVTISVAPKDKELAITVADTGIGISSENLANLFSKFYRIQNEKTKDIKGTGLGLWITAEIVKRMKGRIKVESIEGVGSHFTVFIPMDVKK